MDPALDASCELRDCRAAADDSSHAADAARGSHKEESFSSANLGFLAALPSKKEVIRQFTPSWFTVTMGTGSVALSISTFPFQFPGQQVIAEVVWWFNVVLFILFSVLMLGRLLVYPETVPLLLRHPNQSLFFGAVPMAWSTITNGVLAFLCPRHAVAAEVGLVMFWVNLPVVVICVLFEPFVMVALHENHMQSMTAVWLVPVIPACVAGNTAGVVARVLTNESQGMTLIYVGYLLLGVGFLLSYQVVTIYYNRLMCHSFPAREVIVSSFLPVGPFSMTALGLIHLPLAAIQHLLPYIHTVKLGIPVDDDWVLYTGRVLVFGAGVMALCLWGFALWWLLLALIFIADTVRHGIPFNLGFWGSVFPIGTTALVTCELGSLFDSAALKYLGAIAVVSHVLLWVAIMGLTASRAWTGQLFHAPCLKAIDLGLGDLGPCPEAAAAAEAGLAADRVPSAVSMPDARQRSYCALTRLEAKLGSPMGSLRSPLGSLRSPLASLQRSPYDTSQRPRSSILPRSIQEGLRSNGGS